MNIIRCNPQKEVTWMQRKPPHSEHGGDPHTAEPALRSDKPLHPAKPSRRFSKPNQVEKLGPLPDAQRGWRVQRLRDGQKENGRERKLLFREPSPHPLTKHQRAKHKTLKEVRGRSSKCSFGQGSHPQPGSVPSSGASSGKVAG